MAATQAESQQNDVKLNEAVKCAQKRPQVGGNSASASGNQQLDLESGEKASRGAAQLLKYVNRGGDSSFEMSQYREDIGGHPAGEVKSPRELPQTPQETPAKPEPLALDASGHPAHPGHPFASSVARDYSEEYVNKPSEFTPKQLSDYPGKQPADYGGKPGEFLGKQLDYSSKQSTNEADRGHQTDMDEHYAVSKIEPRLAHIGPGPGSFPGQPRFLSGQSISQATGPTPTLNQLLQASTPVHRFHANYPGIGPESYQQPWPIQRPPVVPPVYPQTSQRPPQTGSPRLHPGPGGPSSPTAMPYPPFTQRFSSPTRPHSPYSHHQLNSYGVQTGHAPSIYPEQRSWNQGGPANPPPPPPTNQANPASQSPQRALSQSPAPPPSASPQPQPSGQPQSFHNIQQRSTTPNTQGIDSGELSGQNSNDSSNGPAGPGTPNSQGMRPTPSPTGSTGSRSMSPAVGQQNVQMPPRPSSSQSDGSGPARMSHSPMTTQGGYQQALGPSPHMHGYKLNSSGPAVVQPGPGPAGLGGIGPMGSGMGYASTGGGAGQQGGYPGQGAYPPPRPHMQFPQGYPPPTNSQPPPNNQYQPARPNNMAQYPPYPHKMGFNNVPSGMPPSPGPPQVYGTGGGPGMVPPGTSGLSAIGNMGPPASSMGPPPPSPNHVSSQPPPTSSAVPHPHPPAATPPLNHEGSPMPPPSTTPNSHPTPAPTPTSHSSAELSTEASNDSGITTTASGTSAINVTSTSSGTVTSVITTGPDGTSLDEGSQQSTLSNASAASGEDPALTPKARKEMIGTYHSHPATPQSTVPSPGAASINSIHEEYPDMSSPGWPRTPASPVFNSHVPQDPYRSKKPDSLAKLYEMDDSMERRTWLDKLVAFMEERRTPITSCPTISKNPLDLFRLYLYVKERGGFMEVTKNKTWKDIAGLLGIGASSSAAYTLRKHYTKHLLAYECHFDRGGVDPQPIINQVEASSKKKNSKSTASVPSPGSSNSQDSFPAAGSSSTSMDGYGSYQSNYTSNAPGGSSAEYTPPPRPPSQSSAPSPHQGSSNQDGQNNAVSVLSSFDDGVGQSAPKSNATPYPGLSGTPGMQQGAYQGGGSYQNYPQDYIRPQGNTMTQQGDFNQPYSPRSHYPQYSPDAERAYAGGNMPPNNTAGQEMYSRYAGGQQPSGYSTATPPSARNNNYISGPQGHPPNAQPPSTSQPSSPSQSPATPTYSCPQDYYRQEQAAYGTPGGNQMYSGGAAANKNMPPPPPGPTQPRRHPDFAKDQQYPPYNQQRPTYPGWTSTTNQYSSPTASNRVPYPSQQSQQQSQQQQQPPQVATAGSPSTGVGGITGGQQWSSQQPPRPSSQPNINAITHAPPPPWDHRYPNQPSPLYPPPGSHQSQLGMNPMIGQQPTPKREMTFPSDSVEAITPLLYKRRKLTRADVAPVEAWRIMMALRSGLLAESCWALDVLNILLFDDTSVSYFGLAHLPGLLDVLLEHFSRSLSDMFDFAAVDDERYWCQTSEGPDVDLGAVTRPIDAEDRAKLLSTSNYTFLSRRGRPVKVVPRDDDLFVLDSRRPWDHQDCEADTEPWQVDSNSTKYIVTSFQSEVSTLPFARHLRDEKPPLLQKEVESVDTKDESKVDGTSTLHDNLDSTKKSDESSDKLKDCGERKQADKKKKTKTLSDVLSRIKKEPMEMNDLTRELFEKKNDVPRKECESEAKANNNMGEHFSGISKTDEDSFPNHNGISDSLSTAELEKREIKREIEESEEAEEVGARDGTDARDETRDEKETSEGPRLKIRDPAGTLKRRRINDYEDESYSRDEASLYLVTESQDSLARRCVCLSTILRNLTFIPGNEIEFAKNVTFLSLLGKLLLLHHEHPVRTQKTRNYDREEDADFADSCSSLQGESEWWWDFLHHIRENVLVMAANIAGHMDLSQHPEEISRPVLDGLLHWAVCPAAHGQDPFPTVSPNSSLSPQRLALEALCKLCVTESNVDLVVATPPYSRLQRLCSVLTRLLCRSEEQVLREFGVNLLHFLSAADSGVARTIALQTPCVALLVAFIEQAESSALGVANQHGLAALRDNPESMGTSLDMLRRAAGTLLNLARHPDNRTLLLQHESRLLALVMSQILDQQVAAIVARVLFQCSRGGVGGAGSNGVSSNNSSSSNSNSNSNSNNTNNVISNVTTTILTTIITNTTTVTTTTTTTTTTS